MIEPELRDLAAAFGLEDFFPYQKELFREWSQTYDEDSPVNGVCLYYRTGAGKTITALAALRLLGFEDVLVIAPPPATGAKKEGIHPLEFNKRRAKAASSGSKDYASRLPQLLRAKGCPEE